MKNTLRRQLGLRALNTLVALLLLFLGVSRVIARPSTVGWVALALIAVGTIALVIITFRAWHSMHTENDQV